MMHTKKFEFNMFPVNTYLLWDETKEAVLIDPGMFFPKEKEELQQFIAQEGLQLKYLLNTHLHLDHILGNPFVGETYGLQPLAHPADEFWLEGAAQQARMFGFELPEEQLALGGHLHEGDSIQFGNSCLQVLEVPGHSPGHLVFYNKDSAEAYVGDVLFQGSVGRADLQGGNFNQLKEQIIKKLFILPDETLVYPGHGPSTHIGNEKRYNPFFTDISTH